MAAGKKKVIIYADWIDIFEECTEEEAGFLIKHFFRYINDQNPEPPNRITKLLFASIKATLKRDLQIWQSKRNVNMENGKKGGRPKKTQKNPTVISKTVGLKENQKKTKKPNDFLAERKNVFSSTLKPFLELYGSDLLNDFFLYWTEENKSKTKLKFEMEKTWNISLRLARWKKNNEKFYPKKIDDERNKQLGNITAELRKNDPTL